MQNKVVQLNFRGQINSETAKKFIDNLKESLHHTPDFEELEIYLSSSGGMVDIAIELYNFICQLNCKTTIINTSCINSAAIIIYLAGDKRICLPASTFYIHKIFKHLDGDYGTNELLGELNEMKSNEERIANLLATHTNKNKSFWKAAMKKGVIISSNMAAKYGLSIG